MRSPERSTLDFSRSSVSSKTRRETPIRDRDYLLDKDGMIFKVIGDSHPESHHLGYVKYYPDARGDRSLFGRSYRQNSVVSKSFGILADRPECYVYSEMLGRVITGVPRSHVAHHYSARETLRELLVEPRDRENLAVGRDLLAIARLLDQRQQLDLFGVTGSFLVGCANKRSDIDLVCYGKEGYRSAREIFGSSDLIQPYAGENQTLLYLRSYLGAYTGAFRSGDVVHVAGKLVHLLDGGKSAFGVELTPWSASRSCIADLTANVPVPERIP